MKKSLYYCAIVTIIQAHFIFACSPPKAESSPVQILILMEENPGSKSFLDNEIEKALKFMYAQNGCKSMAQMATIHGPDTLMNLYHIACQNALREFYTIRNREQAIKAAEHARW